MNGETIRRLRESRGWTQERLAQELGVGQRTVGAWERGETVPRNRLGMIEELFRQWRAEDAPASAGQASALSAFSDTELLMELMSRAHRRERRAG